MTLQCLGFPITLTLDYRLSIIARIKCISNQGHVNFHQLPRRLLSLPPLKHSKDRLIQLLLLLLLAAE